MNKSNQDIRKAIESSGFKYWQIAERFGICDGNFSRKLRKELSTEEKNKIFEIIKNLKGEAENGK